MKTPKKSWWVIAVLTAVLTITLVYFGRGMFTNLKGSVWTLIAVVLTTVALFYHKGLGRSRLKSATRWPLWITWAGFTTSLLWQIGVAGWLFGESALFGTLVVSAVISLCIMLALLCYWCAMNNIFLTIIPTDTIKFIVTKIRDGADESERSLVNVLINSPDRRWNEESKTVVKEKGVIQRHPLLRRFGIHPSVFLWPIHEVFTISIVARKLTDGQGGNNRTWLKDERMEIEALRLSFPRLVEVLEVELKDKWSVSFLIQVRCRVVRPLKAFFDLRGAEMFEQIDAFIQNQVISWAQEVTYEDLISGKRKTSKEMMVYLVGEEKEELKDLPDDDPNLPKGEKTQRFFENNIGIRISSITLQDIRLAPGSEELKQATQLAGVTKARVDALQTSVKGSGIDINALMKEDHTLWSLITTGQKQEVIMAYLGVLKTRAAAGGNLHTFVDGQSATPIAVSPNR